MEAVANYEPGMTCIAGREVELRFRSKRTGSSFDASVVCPARWSRARLLEYVRRQHPFETIRILDWKDQGTAENRWETRLWIVGPAEMLR